MSVTLSSTNANYSFLAAPGPMTTRDSAFTRVLIAKEETRKVMAIKNEGEVIRLPFPFFPPCHLTDQSRLWPKGVATTIKRYSEYFQIGRDSKSIHLIQTDEVRDLFVKYHTFALSINDE